METRTFEVLLANRLGVEARLVELAKKCARKKLTPPTWSWGRVFLDTEVNRPHGTNKVVLTLSAEVPKYAGWKFVAALDHLEGGNFVRSVAGEPVPAEYRAAGPKCDHCKSDRRRNATYVLRHEDGRVVQVGSTCLADFLGTDEAGRLAAAATVLASVEGFCEGGGEGGGGPSEFGLGEFLEVTAFSVREHGWTSRTAARERLVEGSATADFVWNYLTAPGAKKSDYKVTVSPEDKALALEAETWAESLSDEEVNSATGDYLHNVRLVAQTGAVSFRTAGIAASIVTAYQRHLGTLKLREKRATEAAESKYVGTVGKRETWTATLDFVTGYETAYGYTTVLKFKTSDGGCLVWKASNTELARSDVGNVYTVTGTVKKHEEYKGSKQTLVSRCKVAALAEAS